MSGSLCRGSGPATRASGSPRGPLAYSPGCSPTCPPFAARRDAASACGPRLARPASPLRRRRRPQPSIDARTWRPSMDPQRGTRPRADAVAGALAVERRRLAQLRAAAGRAAGRRQQRRRRTARSRTQLGADLAAGVGLGDRAAIGVDVPVFLFQDGTTRAARDDRRAAGACRTSGLGDVAHPRKGDARPQRSARRPARLRPRRARRGDGARRATGRAS